MVPFSLDPPLMGAPKVPPAAWALAGPAVEAPWTGPVPRAPTAPAPLQVVAGRYSLERELGHCGMGDRLSHPGGRPRPPRRDQNAPARFGRPALATRAVPARGPHGVAAVKWRGRPDALKVAGGIVGLLAGMWAFSVASPDRFNWPMYRAAMKSDLRRLVTAESLYYAGHGAYTRDLFALDTPFQLTTD